MTKVTFTKVNGDFTAMDILGHAGFNPGNDIVCSAISALGWTLLGAIKNVPGTDFEYCVKDGTMTCRITKIDSFASKDEINVIFKTVCVGLAQVELSYPKHLSVEIVEEAAGLQ